MISGFVDAYEKCAALEPVYGFPARCTKPKGHDGLHGIVSNMPNGCVIRQEWADA